MQTKKNEFQIEEMQKMAFIGTWEWEIATNKVIWSKELFQIFGLSPEEFIPSVEAFVERVHIDDREKNKKVISQLLTDQTLVDTDLRIIRPDESIRYLECRNKVITDDKGKSAYVIGLCHDVTEKKQISTLFDNIDDGFYSLDLNQKFTFINKKAEEILNKKKEDLLGKNIWDIYPESIGQLSYNQFQKALSEQKVIEFENNSKLNNQWYSIRLFPSPMGLSVYFNNISEKKSAKDKINETESKFRILIEAMPQIAWTANDNGNIDYLNPAWYKYTGIVSGINKDWTEILPHKDASEVLPIWQELLKSQKEFELKMRFKRNSDGTYRWHLCRAVPLINDHNQFIKWFGTCTDIDEEIQAEQKQKFLAEAGQLLISSIDYKTTLENISKIAVPQFADWCAVDMVQNNQILRLAVTHHDPAKIELAKEIAEKYPPSLDAPTGLANVIRTGKSEYMKEIPQILYDAIQDPVLKDYAIRLDINSVIVVPLKLQGKPVGGISFVNDKNNRLFNEKDLEMAEELAYRASLALENAELYDQAQKTKVKLENTNRELEQFAYVASHDLQEPLRTMSSYAYLIKRRNKDHLEKDSIEFLEMIIDSGKRMKNLIDDLLEYSKVDKKEFKTINLNHVFEKTISNLALSIKENNAVIEAENLPNILANSTQMIQLFQNFISNSIKYRSDKDPIIKIIALELPDEWKFSISDNGIGINKNYFDKIFVIFQRLHGKGDKYGGTGIGLSTCKKIIDLHNGKLWLESEEGSGSTFFFTIPKYIS